MACRSPGGGEAASWQTEQPPAGRQAGWPGVFSSSLRTRLSLSSLPPASKHRTQLEILATAVAELTTKSLIVGYNLWFYVHPPKPQGFFTKTPL